MRARTSLYAVAMVLAGFLIAGVGTIAVIADRHCGSEFNYYGCDVPTTNIRKDDSQVTPPPQQLSPRATKQPLVFLQHTHVHL
jgi:hypothetical protein